MVWPAGPQPERVRYVGQLRRASDLKPPQPAFAALGELLLGPKEEQPFFGPQAAVRTPDGRYVWVADTGGRCLHLLDLEERKYLRIVRAGQEPLLSPVDVCPGPEGSVFACDSESVAIHRFRAADGTYLETLRTPEELQRPAALVYDAGGKELFVVDVSGHDIKVLDPQARLLRILGRRGEGPGEFNYPCDATMAGDRLWVADTGNHRIQCLTRDGRWVSSFGRVGDTPGELAMPKGIALDSDGNVYVVDARFENVQIFDQTGRLLLVFGAEGSGPGEFALPAGIHIDPTDRIWIGDSYNGRVQVFDYLRAPPPPATDGAGPTSEKTDASAPSEQK